MAGHLTLLKLTPPLFSVTRVYHSVPVLVSATREGPIPDHRSAALHLPPLRSEPRRRYTDRLRENRMSKIAVRGFSTFLPETTGRARRFADIVGSVASLTESE